MKSNDIRKAFLDFFLSKQHQVISSAPIVVKNDPTLMFTNAGMNQFKDIFLGNSPVTYSRIANTQKCLRVSGKHNDLEEVGRDTYHHTMFEMMGNWSFGDYFKKEAVDWGWEFLTEVLKINKDRLYVSIFEGGKKENLDRDTEAYNFWKQHIDESRIIEGSKKDNFWEMGDTGPCGPCSEIHADIRTDDERLKTDGKQLVNTGHPQVIEIWNLVFIQYNRKVDGTLEMLPSKHVDTGMGFERLCMVTQGVQSTYDTDVFAPLIREIATLSAKKYGENNECDIAMRVIADHVRAISFSIADGQLPSNNKAGYVIRRILRRAIRYGYTFLDFKEPFINKLVNVLVNNMGTAFPELKARQKLIEKVITEEESAFLKTLENGIELLDQIILKMKKEKHVAIRQLADELSKTVNGNVAFELYDTYGFPLDLTQLIAKESGFAVDVAGFNICMEEQKNRSRNAATVDTEDWTELLPSEEEIFTGYDTAEAEIKITKYRKVKSKNEELFQLVFDKTPFYAESGGQVGDSGYIEAGGEKILILDTKKENNLGIHISKKLPANIKANFKAVVDIKKRNSIAANHSATHLLHQALREILGAHVEQKGSLVHPEYLRFDFSHFQKMSDEEIRNVEISVNKKIRQNLVLEEYRSIAMKEAEKMGAIALFGEKYSNMVRAIKFGTSVELCGGIHVRATGQIGRFKIISGSAIAAGIRRIEAITSEKAEEYFYRQQDTFDTIKELLKNPKNITQSIEALIEQNSLLQKQLDIFEKEKITALKNTLLNKIEIINGINVIATKFDIGNANSIKDIAFQLKDQVENLFFVAGAEFGGKANITILISENLVKEKNLNANTIIRKIAGEINGGGGGQSFYATAGGKNPDGLGRAIEKAKNFLMR